MGLFLTREEKRRIEEFETLEIQHRYQEEMIGRLELKLHKTSDKLGDFKLFYRNLPTKLNVKSIYDYKQKDYVKNRFKDKYPDVNFDNANARLMDYFITKSEYSDIKITDNIAEEIWNLMLLDTVEYRNFCYTFFSKMIEHTPYDDKDLSEKEIREISRKIVKSVKKREPSRLSSMKDSYDNTEIMLLVFMAVAIDDFNTTEMQDVSSFDSSSSSFDSSSSSFDSSSSSFDSSSSSYDSSSSSYDSSSSSSYDSGSSFSSSSSSYDSSSSSSYDSGSSF